MTHFLRPAYSSFTLGVWQIRISTLSFWLTTLRDKPPFFYLLSWREIPEAFHKLPSPIPYGQPLKSDRENFLHQRFDRVFRSHLFFFIISRRTPSRLIFFGPNRSPGDGLRLVNIKCRPLFDPSAAWQKIDRCTSPVLSSLPLLDLAGPRFQRPPASLESSYEP